MAPRKIPAASVEESRRREEEERAVRRDPRLKSGHRSRVPDSHSSVLLLFGRPFDRLSSVFSLGQARRSCVG